MASSPKLVIKGEKELIKKLRRLSNKRQLKKVLRRATNASAQVVVRGVRSEWPEDTGLSKRSVTKKVVSGKSGYTAIIGIDKDAAGVSHGRFHDPSQIDHLVEFGYQAADGTDVPAVAPLRKGYDKSADAAKARYAEKAGQEIEREAAKK